MNFNFRKVFANICKYVNYFFRIAEDTILALANVARQMNDRGKMKEADKVLNFARYV